MHLEIKEELQKFDVNSLKIEASSFLIAKENRFCHSKKPIMETKTAIISVDQLAADNVPELRKTLEGMAGVLSVDFSLERSVAVIEFDPQQSHIDDFLRAILKAGFKVL